MISVGSNVRVVDGDTDDGNFEDLYPGPHKVIEANERMVFIELEPGGSCVWLMNEDVEEWLDAES